MASSVMIKKGNKSGMTVILNPEIPFPSLLEDLGKKFRESSRFWGAVQMTLTLEGRELLPSEELQVVDAITSNSQIEILCLLDTDANRIVRCEKALTERLMELASTTGEFHKGSLGRGDVLESEHSVVIIGDVEHGARVLAKGNVIILGALHGTVQAGMEENQEAVIMAFEMAPVQLRIASCSIGGAEKAKRLGRGPMIASVAEEKIQVRSIKKSFLNYFNFI